MPDIDADPEKPWLGVTVTRELELRRIEALRKNVWSKRYHATFDSLFGNSGEAVFRGIDWGIFGTMAGPSAEMGALTEASRRGGVSQGNTAQIR